MTVLGRHLVGPRAAPRRARVRTAASEPVQVGGCNCGASALAAHVLRTLGLTTVHPSGAGDWRRHIAEERARFLPALRAVGEGASADRLDADHLVYLQLLAKGLPLPRWPGVAHSVTDHSALEDALAEKHADALVAWAAAHPRPAAAVTVAGPFGLDHVVVAPRTVPVAATAARTDATSWWPWLISGGTVAAAALLGLRGWGLAALGAAGATWVVAPTVRGAGRGAGRAPTLPPAVQLSVDQALDREADRIYDYVLAYWKAYETGLGGRPAPGVDDAVAAIDAASANINADIQARVAKGQKQQEAFLGAVGVFFGASGRSLFEKVIGFADWLGGSDKGCDDPALRDEAKACADAYATYGAPLYLVADRFSQWSLSNYCQLRGQYCGLKDDFLRQTPSAQEALRGIARTMLGKAKMPAVSRILRFSLGAFVADGPAFRVPAVQAAVDVPRPFDYSEETIKAHPTYGRTYGMEGAEWLVAAVQLAAAQYDGDPRLIMRSVYRETKDRSWQFSKEFPGDILSRLKGHLAKTYDYGAGEHHVANPPGAGTAIRAQWARLAYLAAQGRPIKGALDDLIIPMGYNVGEDAAGGVTMGE